MPTLQELELEEWEQIMNAQDWYGPSDSVLSLREFERKHPGEIDPPANEFELEELRKDFEQHQVPPLTESRGNTETAVAGVTPRRTVSQPPTLGWCAEHQQTRPCSGCKSNE